jgi:hypothetical protein
MTIEQPIVKERATAGKKPIVVSEPGYPSNPLLMSKKTQIFERKNQPDEMRQKAACLSLVRPFPQSRTARWRNLPVWGHYLLPQ